MRHPCPLETATKMPLELPPDQKADVRNALKHLAREIPGQGQGTYRHWLSVIYALKQMGCTESEADAWAMRSRRGNTHEYTWDSIHPTRPEPARYIIRLAIRYKFRPRQEFRNVTPTRRGKAGINACKECGRALYNIHGRNQHCPACQQETPMTKPESTITEPTQLTDMIHKQAWEYGKAGELDKCQAMLDSVAKDPMTEKQAQRHKSLTESLNRRRAEKSETQSADRTQDAVSSPVEASHSASTPEVVKSDLEPDPEPLRAVLGKNSDPPALFDLSELEPPPPPPAPEEPEEPAILKWARERRLAEETGLPC